MSIAGKIIEVGSPDGITYRVTVQTTKEELTREKHNVAYKDVVVVLASQYAEMEAVYRAHRARAGAETPAAMTRYDYSAELQGMHGTYVEGFVYIRETSNELVNEMLAVLAARADIASLHTAEIVAMVGPIETRKPNKPDDGRTASVRTSQSDGSDWPIKCPHCGDELLTSEDRGLHCDGCDDLTAEDIDEILAKFTSPNNAI